MEFSLIELKMLVSFLDTAFYFTSADAERESIDQILDKIQLEIAVREGRVTVSEQ